MRLTAVKSVEHVKPPWLERLYYFFSSFVHLRGVRGDSSRIFVIGEKDVSGNLDTTSVLHHNSGMKRTLQFGFKVLVATALTRLAPACGDPLAQAVAGTKARLVIQGHDSIVRIGEPVFANLFLPKDSPLPTGRLSRASCTSLQFTVEPAVGWHDPWAGWYYSGIPQHATGRDGPYTCGVMGGMKGMPIPHHKLTSH